MSSFLENAWAVVLAAGSGKRLQTLTRDAGGMPVPKQYCALLPGMTLLDEARERAARVVQAERVVTIVARQHQRWWANPAMGYPRDGLVVQPANRGTAIGILLAALSVQRRDPDAVIAFLPSDHHVRDEAAFASALRDAQRAVARAPARLVLLGIAPEENDPELGYIVPAVARGDGPRRVLRFVEKPDRAQAAALLAAGALWNSFIFVAHVATLIAHCAQDFGEVVASLAAGVEAEGPDTGHPTPLARIYDALPEIDFSRHVLASRVGSLDVIETAPCGWTDLGTPQRVARCVQALDASPARRTRAFPRIAFDTPVLARRCETLACAS